jgi:hypothetical protein
MVVALVLFGIAALGGLVLATQRFRGAPQPALPLALLHGAIAAAGLIALIVAVTGAAGTVNLAKAALVVFLVAALGGFFLISQHLSKKPLPIPVVVIHALVAVTGFILLLIGVTQRP